MGLSILGTGSYLPPLVVTNDDLAGSLETSDEWIYQHTGIHSRHVAEGGECTSTMAVKAARAAMASARVTPEEIGLVLVATSTPDYATFPSTAAIVQDELGCANAGACDVQAACAGFVYALEQARGFAVLHPELKVLVIGAECLSRIMDWTDRSTCILFGDGAGAVVIGSDGEAASPSAYTILGADGSGRHFIERSGGTSESLPLDAVTRIPMAPQPSVPRLTLAGHEVFAYAVRTMARLAEELCAHFGHPPSALDRVFAHQANGRIIEAIARRMQLPLENFWLNLKTTANTSAASIPISLDQAVRTNRLREGMKIVMVAFGSGLSYGGTYTVWPRL